MKEENCDLETGICAPGNIENAVVEEESTNNGHIIYVGDPMCSWCYGIGKELIKLKAAFQKTEFQIVVGGLRPGGGDTWNDKFKGFLKLHWEEVNKRSGQEFGNKLFDLDYFNYDTEPSCRAVVASRPWTKSNELDFFESVSRRFYLDNEDPNQLAFYHNLCIQFDIPFDDFKKSFNSEETKYLTNQEFQLNRQWGVTGYPTVLYKKDNQLFQINHGYTSVEEMTKVINNIINKGTI